MKSVVKLTGINENTLRAWERRYQLVTPSRSEGGMRLYSEKDIEKLRVIARLTQSGQSIGQLKELSLAQMKSIESKFEIESDKIKFEDSDKDEFFKTEEFHLSEIFEALKKFDLEEMYRALENAKFRLSTQRFISNLVLPLLAKVGDSVESGALNVSQEHLLSSMLRDYLGTIYQSYSPYEQLTGKKIKKFIFTTREGDLHEFGILLSAIVARIYRKQTYYLGPNTPVEPLIEAVNNFGIDVLVLGLSLIPSSKEVVSPMDFLKILDFELPKSIEFIVGGSATSVIDFDQFDRRIVRLNNMNEFERFISN